MSSHAPDHLRQARRLAGALALVAFAAAPAAAQTTTFEDLAHPGGVSFVQNCTASGGLTFTAVGLGCDVADAFSVYGPGNEGGTYTGSAALFNNLTAGVDITTSTGGAFNLTSVSLTPGLGAFSFDPMSVMFTGMLNGGGMVTQTFAIGFGTTMPSTFGLSGFTNVTSVRYEVTAPLYDGVQIDDLVYSNVAVVPEPATVLLLGTGLAGLAVFARRRQRQ